MGDETTRAPIFPATCVRCGGRVSEAVSFCPHCGAHAWLAFGDRPWAKKPDAATASAAHARAHLPHDKLLWPSQSRPVFASADADPYRDTRLHSLGGARHWRLKASVALALLACVALYGGTVLLHQDDSATREQQTMSSTVEGSVTTDGVSQTNQGSTPPQAPTMVQGSGAAQGSITPQSPTAVQDPATAAAPAAAASSVASVQAVAPAIPDRETHSQNEKASSPSSTASNKGYGDRNHRLMSLALARAHSGLEKNDLAMARSGIYWALSLQPDNSEALMLKQDLLSRQKARDAGLHAARTR
ncbi:MAG TPA: zinc ribbon domain-containing protein [Rhizomicrobium sp.]